MCLLICLFVVQQLNRAYACRFVFLELLEVHQFSCLLEAMPRMPRGRRTSRPSQTRREPEDEDYIEPYSMSFASDGRLVDSSGSGQPSMMMQMVMGRMARFLQERDRMASSSHTDPAADSLQESQPQDVLEKSQPEEEERQYQILEFPSPPGDQMEVGNDDNSLGDEEDSEMGKTGDAAAATDKADEKKKKKLQKKKEKKRAKKDAAQ